MAGGYYNAQGQYVLSKEEFVELVLREQAVRKKKRMQLEKEAKKEAEEKERIERLERIKKNRAKSKLNTAKNKVIACGYKLIEKERKDGNSQLSFVFE